MQKRNYLLINIGVLLLSFALFSFSACIGEPIAPIRVQNDTEETLSIFINNDRVGNVTPGEEIKNKRISIIARYVIEARNSHGQTVYKEEITYEKMKKIEWKVIISTTINKK